MIEDTQGKDSDGIILVLFTTSSIMLAAAELFVYGTAIKLRKKFNSSIN